MRSMMRKNVNSAPPNTKGEASSRAMYRSRTSARTGLLYHSRVRWPATRGSWRRALGLALVALAALAADALGASGVPDRLERFRELARGSQRLLQGDAEAPADAYRELYALLDEEIVESLATGGPFASAGFLQDRLDAFSDAWGATAVGIVRVGRVVVGAFQFGDAAGVNTVRVYGRFRGEPALLTTLHREGRPSVYPLPPAPGGAAQFLAAWEGASSGRGMRELRLDLVRQDGDGAHVVWSTADLFADRLVARSYAVRGAEVRVRYELRYPGWTPGCEGQTEAEEVFRLAPATGIFMRATQSYHDAWHRELHATAARLFDALAAGDRSTVARLVPDGEVRRRLPAALSPEPACDAPEGRPSPRSVSVAATADRVPWSLVFRRSGDGWQLARAAPVLE